MIGFIVIISLGLSLYLSYSIKTTVIYFCCFIGILWLLGVSQEKPKPQLMQVLTDNQIEIIKEPEMPALDVFTDTGDYLSLARFYAEKHNVNPELIWGVMLQETGGTLNPNLVSPKGAAGLMQFMPKTGEQYGLSKADRFNPEKAIEAGVRHIKYLRTLFDDDRLVLAAYNAGEGNVREYKGIPPFKETQGYVKRIWAMMNGFSFHGGRCENISCLSLKEGATAGGKSLPELVKLAITVQNQVPIIWFSSLNDGFPHAGKGHREGRAFDVVLVYPFQRQQAIEKIKEIAEKASLTVKIIDEYSYPSARSTGGHLHVEIPATILADK